MEEKSILDSDLHSYRSDFIKTDNGDDEEYDEIGDSAGLNYQADHMQSRFQQYDNSLNPNQYSMDENGQPVSLYGSSSKKRSQIDRVASANPNS